jgi:hypothetical protein
MVMIPPVFHLFYFPNPYVARSTRARGINKLITCKVNALRFSWYMISLCIFHLSFIFLSSNIFCSNLRILKNCKIKKILTQQYFLPPILQIINADIYVFTFLIYIGVTGYPFI